MKFRYIPLEQISLRKNIRNEADEELGGLIASIDRFEVLQPVLVRPRGQERYELISGHRRYLAVKMQGDSAIPCIIREDLTDHELPFVQLVENVQRKQMRPHELVRVFDALIAETPGLTKCGIASMLGKSSAWVYDKYKAEQIYQSLLQEGLDEETVGELSESALKKLAHVAKEKERARIAAGLQNGKVGSGAICRARSYRINRRGMQHLLDMAGGFCVLIHSDRRLQVLCKSSTVRTELVSELERIKIRRIENATPQGGVGDPRCRHPGSSQPGLVADGVRPARAALLDKTGQRLERSYGGQGTKMARSRKRMGEP